MSADAVTSRPLTRPRLATVGPEVRRRWTAAAHIGWGPLQVRPLRGDVTCAGGLVSGRWCTAAAHVGCGRPTVSLGAARLRLVEPPAGRASDVKGGGTRGNPGFTRDKARGGNMVSPTLKLDALGESRD